MKRIAAAVVLLAAAAVAALAPPAQSADTGQVIATVSIPNGPTPCIQLAGSGVDFGSHGFTDPSAPDTPEYPATPDVGLTSCSSAPQNLLFSSTAATGPGGSWTPANSFPHNVCTLGPNVFEPAVTAPGLGTTLFTGNPNAYFSGFAPSQHEDLTFLILMPCQGSSGTGETFSMTFTVAGMVA
jgi:hypothetical protein